VQIEIGCQVRGLVALARPLADDDDLPGGLQRRRDRVEEPVIRRILLVAV